MVTGGQTPGTAQLAPTASTRLTPLPAWNAVNSPVTASIAVMSSRRPGHSSDGTPAAITSPAGQASGRSAQPGPSGRILAPAQRRVLVAQRGPAEHGHVPQPHRVHARAGPRLAAAPGRMRRSSCFW